eukprot:m.233360 g.233360  ORF g.233360 m.233360 type:complete len:1163 (+) comp17382_c0_seq2:127-3615(+)
MAWLSSSVNGLMDSVSTFTQDVLNDEDEDPLRSGDTEQELQMTQQKLIELHQTAVALQEERDRLLQGRETAEERADAAEEQIHSMATEYRQLLQDKQQEIDTLKLTVAQVKAKMDDQSLKDMTHTEALTSTPPAAIVASNGDDSVDDLHASITMQARINGLEQQLEQVTAERNRLQTQHATASTTQHEQSTLDLEARVVELSRQLQTAQDFHQEELMALQQRHAQALSALHAQYEEAEDSARSERSSVSSEVADQSEVHVQLQHANDKLAQLTDSNKRLRDELSALEDELADALEQSQETSRLKAQVTSLQQRLKASTPDNELETLRKDHTALQHEYDAVWAELEEHQERVVALQQQLQEQSLSTENHATTEQLEALLMEKQDELSVAYSQLKEVKNMAQAQHDASLKLQTANVQLQQKGSELEEQYNSCLQQLTNMRTDEQQTQQRALELHAELMAKDKELRKLQSQATMADEVPVVDTSLKEANVQLQAKVDSLETQVTTAEQAAAQAAIKYEELQAELQAVSASLTQTRQALQDKTAALVEVQEQPAIAPATNGHNQVEKDMAGGLGNNHPSEGSELKAAMLQTELLALRERLVVDAQAAQEVEASMLEQQTEFAAARVAWEAERKALLQASTASQRDDNEAATLRVAQDSNQQLQAQFKDLHAQFKEELAARDLERTALQQKVEELTGANSALELTLQQRPAQVHLETQQRSHETQGEVNTGNTSNDTTGAVAAAQAEQAKELERLQACLVQCQQELQKKEQQLATLQQHLLTLEQQHTVDLLEAQQQASSVENETSLAHSELAAKLQDTTQRYAQTQQRVLKLEDQVTVSIRERDTAVRQAAAAKENEQLLQTQLASLQEVLRDFEEDSQSKIDQVTLDLESQLARARTHAKELELELTQSQRRVTDVQGKLTQAQQELSSTNYDRGLLQSLEHENNRLRSTLDSTQARLSSTVANTDENLMDLSMIKNTVLKYFKTTDKTQKQQVLRVLAGLCDFSTQDQRDAGLLQPTGFLSSFFGGTTASSTSAAKPQAAAPKQEPTISTDFVEFLLSSSSKTAPKQPLAVPSPFPQETASVALQPPATTASRPPAASQPVRQQLKAPPPQPPKPASSKEPTAAAAPPVPASAAPPPVVGISLPGLDSSFSSKKSPLEQLLNLS